MFPPYPPPPPKKIIFFPLSHLARVWRVPEGGLARRACGLVVGWAGLGVVIAVAAPGFLGHLPSNSDLGVKLIMILRQQYHYIGRLFAFFTLNMGRGPRAPSLDLPVFSYIGWCCENSFDNLNIKVPISSKLLFSYLILYLTQWTSAKEKFDLDKMQSFLEVLKTFKFAAILVHHSHQSSPLFEWVVT